MPPRSFSLSLAAVDMLSQVLQVNCRLYPFEIPSFGELDEDRNRIAKLVFADLANRGLIRDNTIDTDVRTALTVTGDHDVAVAMTGNIDTARAIQARAAAAGSSGVLAVQEGQSVRFEMVSPSGLARALVGLLPPLGPGPGQSVQVVQAAPAARSDGFTEAVRAPRSSSDAQLRMAAAMLERPRKGFGFFMVTAKGRHGREIDTATVGWIDTDAGRYLMVSKPSVDGEVRVTYSPADSPRLTQQLAQVIEESRR